MQLSHQPPHPGLQGRQLEGILLTRQQERAVWKWLMRQLFTFPGLLAGSVLTGVGIVCTSLLVPQTVGKWIDALGASSWWTPAVYRLMIQFAVAAGLWIVCLAINTFCTQRILYAVSKQLRAQAMRKALQLPFSTLDRWAPGDLLSRMIQDVDAIREGFSTGILVAYFQVLVSAGSCVLLFRIHPYLGAILLVLSPFCFYLPYRVGRSARKDFQFQQESMSRLMQQVQEGLEHADLIRSLNREQEWQRRCQLENETLQPIGERAQFASSLTNPIARFIGNLMYLAVGATAALLAVRGSITYGMIATALAYTLSFSGPLHQIFGMLGDLQKALTSAGRIWELLQKPVPHSQRDQELQVTEGRIAFDQISFGYEPDSLLYQDWSLKLKPGSKVALVGATGCGKTTLVELLLQYYPLQKGRILIDGQDLQTCTLDSLYRQVGMVFQESWLFTGTVYENLVFACPERTREEVEAAARATHAHACIQQLPQGYDTVLEAGGQRLSQGQKQLLAVTRVLLLRPQILILDEATSNVDIQTEEWVQDAFEKLMEGKTTLIIAHRLSTIRKADHIVVLDQGRLIEEGDHETLVKKHGFYYQLYSSQLQTEKSV